MTTTTYPSLSQRTQAWAATEHLSHAEPVECLAKFGMTKPLPRNKASKVKFRRPVPLTLATTPLTEGSPPASLPMQYEDIEVTLSQYGSVVDITDVVHDMAEDPVLKDATQLTGEQNAETFEALLWGILQGGTNVFYANGTARNQVNTPISKAKQKAVIRTLKAERAKKITSMMSSDVKYGSEAVAAAFIAFAHTDLQADIEEMDGFVPVEKYGMTKPLPYEIGKVGEVRYILSPVLTSMPNAGGAAGEMMSTNGTSADVYSIIYIGKDAYGHVPLKGKEAVEMKIRQPGQIDSNDKLGQIGWVGWKAYWKGFIANQMWMARVEVAASKL